MLPILGCSTLARSASEESDGSLSVRLDTTNGFLPRLRFGLVLMAISSEA
jgi:hypothetical protein